jgi:cytochrome-b5 reductase
MPIASCVVIKAPGVDDGKDAVRPYTPVTTNRDLGHFDFVVKRYPNGKGSVFLTDVKVGDSVEFKGPYAKIQYSPNFKKKVGMLAGGTGITPMLQILLEALSNPEDKTEYTLLFGNVSEADILLKDQLDDLAKKHSNFKVHYVLDKAPQGWTGSVGFIGADLIKKFMPEPSDDNIVLVCGPPPMVKSISGPKKSAAEQGELTGILKDLHYTESQVFKF